MTIEISKVKYTFKYKIIKKFPFLSSFMSRNSILAKGYDKDNNLVYTVKLKDLRIWL
jgi:hypothetical protein